MTNREMFHQMLNSRHNPEQAYAILSGMAAADNHQPAERTNIEKQALRLKRLGDPALSLSLLDAFLDGSLAPTSATSAGKETSA